MPQYSASACAQAVKRCKIPESRRSAEILKEVGILCLHLETPNPSVEQSGCRGVDVEVLRRNRSRYLIGLLQTATDRPSISEDNSADSSLRLLARLAVSEAPALLSYCRRVLFARCPRIMSRQVACVHALVWVLLYVGTIGADVESTFYKCCQEGNMWAASASSCDSLAKKALASVVSEEHRSSCEITMDICCRATMRERFCDAGKAAARSNKGCETPDDQCPGDTYKDCCDGCRLGLAAAKLGTSCNFDTFSLGLPWDDAFQHCCTGKDEQSAAPDHENEVLVPTNGKGPKEGCPAGFKMRDDGSCMPIGPPQEHHPKPADGHLCEQYNPCMHKCRNSGTTLVCECHEGYRLEEDNKSCAVSEAPALLSYCRRVLFARCPRIMSRQVACVHALVWVLLYVGTIGADVESTFYKCCQEGNMWAASASSCDSLAKKALASVVSEEHRSSCEITMDICCRATMRERFCDAGKAAARSNKGCETPDDQCPGDTYKDCCDGCRLGLAAAKLGTSCNFDTFSLGLPWDDAFQHCCTGKDEQSAAPDHENEVLVPTNGKGPKEGCPAGFKMRDDGSCMPIGPPQEHHPKPADGHLCEQYNPCMHKCRNSGTTLVCECHEGYRLEEDNKSCADVDECSDGTHNCDLTTHECMNKPGGFGCIPKSDTDVPSVDSETPQQCEAGFKYNSAMKDCIDVDECSEGLDDCGMEQQTCLNTYGGFQCLSKDGKECPAGYKWNEDSCVDVNECAESLHACDARFEEECKNTVGGYVCNPMCSKGLRYSHHFEKCLDVDECQEGTHTCGSVQLCTNTEGGFTCRTTEQCQKGFRYNRVTRKCEDIDECQERTHDCNLRSQACINVNGSYSCRNKIRCPAGYRLDENTRSCIDVDECLHGLHSCSSRESKCVNTVGSYRCIKKSRYYDCPRGFVYSSHLKGCEAKPADGHLCEQYNPCMHKCRNSGTTLVCECHEGYRLEEDNKSCADVDECSDGTHNCDLTTHECMNKPGGFGCIPKSDTDVPSVDSETPQQCEAGFKYNSAMKDCIDVDECSEGLDDCGMEQQTCLNTYGGFQCLSKDGKECPAGYKWNEDSCVDVNECAESLHACDARFEEECKNTVGGYVCNPMCSKGLRYSHHFEKCLDVDECQEGTHTCGSVQLCTNTEGGFTCRTTEQCQKGFRYNRVTRKCEDIDECQERTHDCNLRSQACINVNGSYSCRNKIRCPAGYRLDENTRSCIDVDECLHGLHSCSSRESKCVNTVGSYRCIKKSRYYDCPRGFVYSSHLKGCEDVDECAEGLDGCSDDQVCVNAVGSFSCVPRAPQAWCHRGYRRDPVTRRCEDINECQEYTHSCVGDMVCINTKGSYMCEKRQPTNPGVKDHSGGQHGNGHSNKCAPGMRSDPLTGDCRDINECEEQRPCGENERCHNLIGTYTCTCMDGYRRDSSTGPCKGCASFRCALA
ncbi:fibulin-1 isoform X4 [Ixodes scapularis]